MDSQATPPWVLLVDDEPLVHAVATRTLKRVGWEVLNATDGLQAIDLLSAVDPPPSLVIADMRMPRMGGAELGQWIESRYPTVPILYISGFLDPLPPPARNGLSESLGKPFTPAALLQAVLRLYRPNAQMQH